MNTLAYIGNALDAAGWRLAGAVTYSPGAGEEAQVLAQVLAQARQAAQLVLVSHAVALALPLDELDAALAALRPLVLVLPDDAGAPPLASDPAERVRRQLGLEAEAPVGAVAAPSHSQTVAA